MIDNQLTGARIVHLVLPVEHNSAFQQEIVFGRNDLTLRLQDLDTHVEREQKLVVLEQRPTGIPETHRSISNKRHLDLFGCIYL